MKNTSILGRTATVRACDVRINPPQAVNPIASYIEAALYWRAYGLNAIPIIPGTKQTAVKWEPWLDRLTMAKIAGHWSQHPDHELGFIVGDDIIVLDADSPEAKVALAILEKTFDVTPNLTVNTTKGVHHYYKRAAGTFAKSDSHSTEEYPERLDVKTGRSMVILPPSTGKSLDIDEAENAGNLTEVGQEFIDAVFHHNGRPAPRPFESSSPEHIASAPSSREMSQLQALLCHLSPSCGYEDWLHAGMVTFHVTDGSDEGLDLFDTWSRGGNSYKGRKEIEAKWRSFNVTQNNPVTIGTLIKMVTDKGGDWIAVCDAVEPQFQPCNTVTIHADKQPADAFAMVSAHPKTCTAVTPTALPKVKPRVAAVIAAVTPDRKAANPLDKFSLRGMSDELEKNVVASLPLLDEVALMGQLTALFATPNTGKTLIVLSRLIDAIKDGRIDPTKLYYLNMDDTSQGLLEKLRLAEEYNFHMLAEGHRDFTARSFLDIIRGMTEADQASGVMVVLDTLKKFVDLMDKGRTSAFTNVIRSFVTKGGTVIALAHTNKHPGKDGKPIYGGVSDTLNDFDCAYTIAPISVKDGVKVVEFTNIKRRGDVVDSAAYSYCVGNKIPYNEILLSVQAVDQDALEPLKLFEAVKSDAEIISAVTACIGDGINSKMKLADATATRSGISKRKALQVIEKYNGDDPVLHRWKFRLADRGAKVFAMLDAAPPDASLGSTAT